MPVQHRVGRSTLNYLLRIVESGHATQDSRCRRNRIILRLSDCRAPGLEQEHNPQSLRERSLRGALQLGRCLGRAHSVRLVALSLVSESPSHLMLKNAFAGHPKRPTELALATALGQAHHLWQALVKTLQRDLGVDSAEWSTHSVKAGWSLRLQSKKRNIVYLSPGNACFMASLALGDKAVAAARKSTLPPKILKIIDQARRYAEGTAVRVEVCCSDDIDSVKTLAKIKMEN
jgi:hypothetical protein